MASTSYDWNKCLEYSAATDVGMRRANNQDALNVALAGDVEGWYRQGHMFLVADGMGAHAAGELASRLAVDTIPHLYQKYGDKSPPEALQKAIFEANAEVHRRGQANSEFHNMGTTCEVFVLLPQGALLAHIGDSRIYRLRGEKLHQLTFDHSLLWEMRAAGQVSEDSDLEAAIPKNVITRSLGPNPKVKVDIEGPYPIAVGDTFLICSDGLTGKVNDEEIGPILANLPPQEASQVLIDLANLRGGPDNITTVIIKVTGPEITTQVARAEPLTVGNMEDEPTTVHPALWVVTGVCFLAAIIMALSMENALPALLAAIGGAISLTIGLLQFFGTFASTGVTLTGGRRLGRGPYVEVPCAAGQDMVDNLASLAGELRDAAEGQATDDIQPFDQHCRRASTAAADNDFPEAVRAYCQAISLMMSTLRTTRKRSNSSDSSVDL